MGLSVVSQTLCRTDVFPAFALPIISTRNRTLGIRRFGCWVSMERGEQEALIDLIPWSLIKWFTQFTFRIRVCTNIYSVPV